MSPEDAGWTLRHPTEADQPPIVAVVDDWFAGRRVRHLVVRAWFRHVASTSRIAVDGTGRRVGFLIGYRSPDHPGEAVVHVIGVDPNVRRCGIGRSLVDAFIAGLGDADLATVTAVAWPDDPVAIAFFTELGFEPDAGPGSRRLFGTVAYPDHEGPGEDRVVLVRRGRID
jgi:ribosomal protein S18 acetylase RimI-like enzyme